MILKNFYITDESNKDLKYASNIIGQSEGAYIRSILNRNLKKFYPKDISYFYGKKIRTHLLNKQNNKCAYCGRNGKLEIHHKDKNKLNNLLSNLVILCKSCHAKDDAKSRKPRKKKESMRTHIPNVKKYFGSFIFHQPHHGTEKGYCAKKWNPSKCLTCYTIDLYKKHKRFSSPEKLIEYLVDRKRILSKKMR
jgi:hypothetical protein